MSLARVAHHRARVERRGQPRRDERRALVGVKSEAVDAASERLPPRLGQEQVAQGLLIDVGVQRRDQPRVRGRVLCLPLEVAEQTADAVGGAQRGGLRLGRHTLAGVAAFDPDQQHRGAPGQPEHGEPGERRGDT